MFRITDSSDERNSKDKFFVYLFGILVNKTGTVMQIRNMNLEENYRRKLLVQKFILETRKQVDGDVEKMGNILILSCLN